MIITVIIKALGIRLKKKTKKNNELIKLLTKQELVVKTVYMPYCYIETIR